MIARVFLALALLLGFVGLDRQADAARVVLFFKPSTFLLDGLSSTIINAVALPGGATGDIGFTGGDLNTGALATLVGANSGGIKIWYDQVAAANTILFGGNNAAPMIVNAGVNVTKGGHVCSQYSNATVIGGQFSSSSIQFQGASPVSQPLFFSIVFGFTNTSSDFIFDGASGARIAFGISTTNYAIFAGSFKVGGTVDTSMHSAIVVFNDPGNAAVYIDGGANLLSAGTAGANQLYGGPGSEGFGPNGNTQAFICEAIIGLGVPVAGDMTKLRASAQTYWGTP